VSKPPPDLSPTALYTAGTWAWAGLPGAELVAHKDTKNVFGVVNVFLALVRPFYRRPPSLKHSLVQRHLMIDHLLADSGANDVLELAAGLSTRGVRATADPAVQYVELDRPAVVAKKRELLARSDAGRAALARANLRLVAGDVADAPLAELAPPGRAPLFVIAEGLLMYLAAEAQRALWKKIRALLDARGGTFVFDLVPTVEQAKPGLVGRALGWLMRRFTKGGDFVRDARTRDDVVAELAAAGFAEVTRLEPADAPAAWRLPHLDRRTQQLLFVARVAPTMEAP
jgi:O-methyltransferase involved in polyketide biosynthesis